MARKSTAEKLASTQATIEALLAEARALKKQTAKEDAAKHAKFERELGKAVLALDASLTIDQVTAIVEAHLAAQSSAVPTLVDTSPAYSA